MKRPPCGRLRGEGKLSDSVSKSSDDCLPLGRRQTPNDKQSAHAELRNEYFSQLLRLPEGLLVAGFATPTSARKEDRTPSCVNWFGRHTGQRLIFASAFSQVLQRSTPMVSCLMTAPSAKMPIYIPGVAPAYDNCDFA